MNTTRLVLCFAVIAALAGCGGGGGGGSTPDGGQMTGGGSTPGDGGSIPDPSMMGGIPAAANNWPLAGNSVTQSSIGADGVTTDNIKVDVDYGTGRLASYSVANGDKWSLSSADPETDTIVNVQATQPTRSGLTVFAVGAVKPKEAAPDDPEIVLVLLTDIESASDTDYLVWGNWNIANNSISDHRDSIEGVFATGSDPFTQGNLPALTGTATYRGDARGQYFEPNNPGQSWSAIAELTADFGDGSGLGTISGNIDEFRFSRGLSGDEVDSPMTEVTLSQTDIGSANSGFFQGTTDGTFNDGTELSGRWGGQFFGNNGSDGIPGSVAGTFGAVSDDDTRGLIGAFGAPKQ